MDTLFPLKIGFTGTQGRLTDHQAEALRMLIHQLGPGHEFHHGDCIGADAFAHNLAREAGWRTVAHPPNKGDKRAFVIADELRAPYPYLTRNKHIVAECDFLIACPKQGYEIVRSGTWATVRAAKTARKPYYIVSPERPFAELWTFDRIRHTYVRERETLTRRITRWKEPKRRRTASRS